MSRAVRMLLASALGVLGFGVVAAPASAGIWTEIPSGTLEEISAIEYQSDTRFWFTTKSGSIYSRQPGGNFVATLPATGVALNDIEFQDGGNIGLAVGNGGQVFRSDNGGATWSSSLGGVIPVSKRDTTFVDCTETQTLGDVYSVRFAGNSRAWIFAEGSQLARSQGTAASVGAAGTWVDANRDTHGTGTPADDTCKVHPAYADGYADGFFVPGNPDVGYIVAASFSTAFLTTNNLATSAAERTAEAGNAGSTRRNVAGDPANPSRMWATAPENYGISVTAYTSDGFQTAERWKVVNDDRRTFSPPYDVDFAGGTVLAAGDAGMIVNSVDGANFFYNDADVGGLQTAGWRAVGLASATHGAVGGVGGKLVVTTSANVTPDIIKPTGTISGPASANAGQPVTFTLNAADTGGSGLNSASFAWTSAGLPGASGNPVQFTFPSPGFYTVRVTFADHAGNTAEATKSITINRAPAGGGGGGSLPVSFTGPGNTLSAKIVGNRVRIRARGTIRPPAGVSVRDACKGKVKLTVKRKRKTLATRRAKLKLKNGKCRFGKTIFIKRSKVGRKTTSLRLKVSFGGNAVLKAGSTTKTLVIKK